MTHILACRSVSDYLLHELARCGKITSVRQFAIAHGFEYCYLLEVARRLEAQKRVRISRTQANGPLTIEPLTPVRPAQTGLVYQLALSFR